LALLIWDSVIVYGFPYQSKTLACKPHKQAARTRSAAGAAANRYNPHANCMTA